MPELAMTPEFIVLVAFGLLLLLLGRKLFWAYVAILGFLIGYQFTLLYFPTGDQWMPVAAGLAIGLVGAVLAMALQYVAVGVAGFVGGAYLAMNVLGINAVAYTDTSNLIIVGGAGVLGMALFLAVFDPALIILTSATGAALITEALVLEQPTSSYAFLGLTLFGIFFQFLVVSKARRPVDS